MLSAVYGMDNNNMTICNMQVFREMKARHNQNALRYYVFCNISYAFFR